MLPNGILVGTSEEVNLLNTTTGEWHLENALAGGASLPDALRRGLAAGALAVTVRGASQSLPTAAAIDTFLAAQS